MCAHVDQVITMEMQLNSSKPLIKLKYADYLSTDLAVGFTISDCVILQNIRRDRQSIDKMTKCGDAVTQQETDAAKSKFRALNAIFSSSFF